jgi:putative glycerol-1-phosphate prenyltransferase
LQLHPNFDATLFISLISGRNPDYLIGHHVASAGMLKKWNQEVISTGYMLIDGGQETSASYMSFTKPIPRTKKDIAVATALAGEYLGMKLIYLDAGSGAINPIPEDLIQSVKNAIEVPLIVGGGINSVEKALAAFKSGADIIVIGNALEEPAKSIHLLKELKIAVDASHSDL